VGKLNSGEWGRNITVLLCIHVAGDLFRPRLFVFPRARLCSESKAAPTSDTDMSRSDQTRLPDQARNKTNCSVPIDPPTLATSACSGNSRCRTGIWPEQTGLFPTRHSDPLAYGSKIDQDLLDFYS
jgi:hypothetical protein